MNEIHPAMSDARGNATPVIVGVGASRGGLAAFESLLHGLDGVEDIAIVFVTSVSASTDRFVEQIAAATSFRVIEVTGRRKIKPGSVYVGAPGTLLEVKNGSVRIAKRESGRVTISPVDLFLHSLAADQGERGVGVILSGTGADGTLGLKAVRDAGGMTFAQSSETAMFDSMPRSAATTGVADHVLSPDKIAEELKKHASFHADADGESVQLSAIARIHDAIPQIAKRLMEATHHNFQHYKSNTLVRRIRRRMQVLKVADIDAYVKLLSEDADEPHALFRELLISVTAFFRDPAAFEVIEQTVIPEIFARHDRNDAVRIWVPGCATGEEAFTLAMLCREQMDLLDAPPEVQIFATDIDARALKTARQAVYSSSIVEEVTPQRLKRFFHKRGKRYQVAKDIRELVLFSTHNLIADPPFSRLDMVSCRNLLIYLGPHLQKKVIPLFHNAIRPSGFLFLGPSENISSHSDLFRMIDADHRISQRKGTGIDFEHADKPLEAEVDAAKGNGASMGIATSRDDLMPIMQRIVLDEFAPRSVIVDEAGKVLCASADMHKYLTVGTGPFQNNIIKMSRSGLRIALRATLQEAKVTRRRVVHEHLSLRIEGELRRVMLTVQPMPRVGADSELFMVVFHDAGPQTGTESQGIDTNRLDGSANASDTQSQVIIAELEQELSETRVDLEKSIQEIENANEELKASNEELLSLNEELRSANEELESSKEEIQNAVNALENANSDLENLLRSTQIATIFLDKQCCIRGFTPAATAIYGLITTDIGRPLANLMPLADNVPAIPDPETITGDEAVEDLIQTRSGEWYVRRVLPYQSRLGEIDGIVMTFTDVTMLHEERERFSSLIEVSSQIVWVTDAQGRVAEDSPSWRAFTGQSQAAWMNNEWIDVIHPDYHDEVSQAWAKSLGTGEPLSVEYPLRHHSGGWRWTQVRAVAQRRHDGTIESWVGMNTDIDDRKQALLELKVREEEIRSLISSTAEGIYGIDLNGNCTFANEACSKLLGYENSDELLGQSMHELVHHSHADGSAYKISDCQIYRAFRNNEQVHVDDEVFWRKDGSCFDAEYWSYPQVREGAIVGCVVTFIDITERKKWAVELADRESHLRRVIDHTLGFIGVLDTKGILREANETAIIAGGLTRDEVIGKPFWECYWWSHDDETAAKLRSAIATALQGEVVRYDVEVRMAGETRLEIDFMLSPVKDADGRVTHLIPSGVDISERKQAEQEAQRRANQLNLALESGRMGLWEWDVQSDHVTWSPHLYEMFGYGVDGFVPTKDGFIAMIHPDDQSNIQRLIDSAFTATCINHEVEFRVIRGSDDAVVWTHCRGTIRRDADNRPLSIVSVAVDITARKQRELSLAFLADLQSSLLGVSSAERIMCEASERVADYMQLSHFMLIEMDRAASSATVISDHPIEDSESLVGVYDMTAFATEDERRQLSAGLPMVVNDTRDPSRPSESSGNFEALNVGAILNVPSNRDSQLQFMISATKKTAHQWRDHEIELVRQLANMLRLKLDRAHAETALIESEAKFRDLSDNISQFAWMADSEGSIFWYNQRWFDYTGTTLEQMKGWGWKAVHHPDHLDRVVKRLQHSWDTGEVWEDTFPLRSKDGEYRWFLSRALPIRDQSGKILRWFGTNTDITEAKQSEEALLASQEQLRIGVEVSQFALAQIDYANNSIQLSREASRLYGIGDAEVYVTRDRVHQTFHPDDREKLQHCIGHSLADPENSEFAIEHRIVMPDGQIRWLDIRKRIFFDESTESKIPTHGILAARDITEQKRWEIELADREAHLRRVINNQLGLVGVVDSNGMLVEIDDRSMSIAGLERSDVIGKHFAECAWWTYDDNVSRRIRESMNKAFAGETVRFDIALYASGNRRLMIDFMIAPVRNDDGEIMYLIPSGVDISERKRAEDQLEQARAIAEAANKSKSEFLANMSHEIRTPMTAILGYTDLIAEKINDEETAQHVQTIRRNGDFLLDIINDILDLSKIEAGKFEISQQRFSPQHLVEDVRSIMDVRASANNIDLIVKYRGTIPDQVESDPKRLRQILINLVGNAIKFTPSGSVELVVCYEKETDQLRFDVVDSGIGISETQRNRLFQAFSQGDGNVNREFGGTGLGLAISKRLTEMLGGEILVESELGKGSTFTVTIATGEIEDARFVDPVAQTAHDFVYANDSDVSLNCRLLVVDDRRDIRFLTKRLLTGAGADVTEAEDGEVAVALVQKGIEDGDGFDLILLDMQMPRLDGYQTAKVLRELGYDKPIIALTADAMQGDMSRCIESGCNDYLSKPIDKTLLLNTVSRLTQPSHG